MASANAPRSGRALAFVAVVVLALYAGVFFSKTHTPELGLDLRGGTSVTLTPKVTSGKVTAASLTKAVEIIRQRVDKLGVSEAQVATEGSNIVVSVPGKGRSDVVDLVRRTAQLRFRQVLQSTPAGPLTAPSGTSTPATSGTPSPSTVIKPSPSQTSNGRVVPHLPGAATPTLKASSKASAKASAKPSASPAVPSALEQRFAALDCTKAANRQGIGTDVPSQEIVACDRDGTSKYVLAPAAVLGTDVRTASATVDNQGLGQWQVVLNFTSKGGSKFGALTKRVTSLPEPTNEVAVVLDGVVQSAPRIQEAILDGRAQITGNFSQKEAQDLANILKFGALPVSFDVPTAQTISPTLGSDQLRGGLIAGAIGLALVVLYSLLYYRALGLVTVASLLLSGLILYAMTTLLGHLIHYTLNLAGIAGYIVAVGITADSFVVYFERLRDEVREGRTLRSGVERGWVRARRTILSADMVSLLAAVVLYLVSIGNVRGFAFTLGLSTVVDLFIVFFFTKPLITLLARTRFFSSGGAMSGLSAGRMRGSMTPRDLGDRPPPKAPPLRPHRAGSRSVGGL